MSDEVPTKQVEQSIPNVVVLIADSLRPDFLSCYGGDTSVPAMEALAERGTTFENAFAVGPNTSISHGGVFTGQYPSESGVVGADSLPEDDPVLPEWLQEAGFDTFGIAGPAKMGSAFGYDRGFDEYFETYTDDKPSKLSPRYLSKVLRDHSIRGPLLRDLVRTATRGPDSLTAFKFDLLRERIEHRLAEPFFALLNTTLVHSPYDPPRPYKQAATPELARPRWHFFEVLFGDGGIDREDVRPQRLVEAQTADGIARYLADPSYLTEAELDVLRSWYRASIRYFDDVLGAFLDWLADEREDTIVIVMSDHGENFGERGLIVHSHLLHEEVLRVPLLVAGPGIPEGERRSDLVSLVDLFDTICDLVDVEPPATTSGSSMFDGSEREAVYAEYGPRYDEPGGHTKYMDADGKRFQTFRVGRKQVLTEDYRYVLTSDGGEELYRRPGGEPIADIDEEVVESLRRLLSETLSETFRDEGDAVELDAGSRANLRDLGYID